MEQQTEIDLEQLLRLGQSPDGSNKSPDFILLNLISNESASSGELTTSDIERCLVQTRNISIIKEPSDKFPFVRVVIETVEGLTQRYCLDDFDYILDKLLGDG